MPSGPGYWLNPETGQSFRVTTHDEWLKDPNRGYRLPDEAEQELLNLTDIDEIRIVGVKAGLIRLRKQKNYFSVQFFTDEGHVRFFLKAVLAFGKEIGLHRLEQLRIHNLRYDDQTEIAFEELGKKLETGEKVLEKES